MQGFFGQGTKPPKPSIVGIDLGTTFSCVGAFQSGTGEQLVFRVEDNKTTIPSIVAFTPSGVLIGREARRQAEENPQNTLFDAKRFIGRRFSKREVEVLQRAYAFRLVHSPDGSVRFAVGGPDRPGGPPEARLVSPEEVGTIIIRRLLESADRELSTRWRPVTVSKAVISVPADFSASQKNATRRAAETAGLEVLRIVSEPTAAALAYGVDKKPGTSFVLVVDLGGGTLDVSLLRKRNGMFWVLGMTGNNRLGGQDFNRRLRAHLLDRIRQETGRTLTEAGDIQRLTEECERVKLELSTAQEARVRFNVEEAATAAASGFEYSVVVSRNEFEMVNDDLFRKVLVPIEAALEMAQVRRADVDHIVMVGGSTRVPRVRELISEYFGGKELDTRVDPELAVAIGVSIQAGVIGGMWPVPVSAVELPSDDIEKVQVADEGGDRDSL